LGGSNVLKKILFLSFIAGESAASAVASKKLTQENLCVNLCVTLR